MVWCVCGGGTYQECTYLLLAQNRQTSKGVQRWGSQSQTKDGHHRFHIDMRLVNPDHVLQCLLFDSSNNRDGGGQYAVASVQHLQIVDRNWDMDNV